MARRKLTEFEGHDVVRSTIKLTGAGDGLSEALAVDAVEFHQGERAYFVVEADCTGVGFEPVDKNDASGAQKRVQKFRASTATVVDGKAVKAFIDEQHERNLKAKEAAAGIQRLPLEGEDGKPAAKPKATPAKSAKSPAS